MAALKITKMHALGNNYIYVSEYEELIPEPELPLLAVAVSDVRKGIGSDGLILIGPSIAADVRMRIFNADGSEAETCGNGLRCVAKYAFEHGYVHNQKFTIETKAGIVEAQVHVDDTGRVPRVTIDMGEPQLGTLAVPYSGPRGLAETEPVRVETAGAAYDGVLVSMGNPHFVSFVQDVDVAPVEQAGPLIEHHDYFPERINVEFVAPIGRSELDFRVWERGSGITYACGTGACAAVVAGVALGKLDEKVIVHLLGGDLEIELRNGRVLMTGEAVHVLSGDFQWPRY